MSIPVSALEVGKCYLAKIGHSRRIRRVVQILSDGRVRYDQRTAKTTWKARVQYKDVFASMLDREVPCDWTPEGDG